MRNKERIYPICAFIGDEWRKTCPDWRFMQLMNNFMNWLGNPAFYMEDEDFIKKFQEYMGVIKNEP